jgi:predicted nucleotidyltransferase
MEQDIAQHRDAIAELCRSLGVESLLAFDSAAGAPNLANDSLVFLVQFKPMPSAQYATSYFSLAARLEALLRTPIELVELEAGDNPYFKEAVGVSRVPVHELSRG